MKSEFTIDREDYKNFCHFLEKHCGILLNDNKQYLVSSRLGGIMRTEGMTSLKQLLNRIVYQKDNALRDRVIDAMTTNETLWFRDNHPYDILYNKLLPELKGKGLTKLRMWSAACSTGQEPYSISMVIDEFIEANFGSFSRGQEIMATDISSKVLAQARQAEYEMLALGRGLSQDRLKKFFRQSEQNKWKLADRIKQRVIFQQLNLLNTYSALGQFDVVFCRNVLIYFSSDLKREILKKIHKQLNPGGYLMLGASESMSELHEKFKVIHCHPGVIYQAC